MSISTTAYVGKSGKLAYFFAVNNSSPFQPVSVTAVNSNPTITWNGDTVAVPLMLNKLTVTAEGTGYTQSTTTVAITGGSGHSATATATVSGGKVTALTITSPGADFQASDTLTVTITDTSGGTGATATATVGPVWAAATHQLPLISYPLPVGSVIRTNIINGGTGYTSPTVICAGVTFGTITVVGGVIKYVEVVSSDSTFTGFPTITITDADGTGAIIIPFMSGASADDTLAYSASSGWFTTADGTAAAATDSSLTNYTGQNPPGVGGYSDFGPATDSDTLQLAINLTSPNSIAYWPWYTAKNWIKRTTNPWQFQGTGSLTSGRDGTPISWPAAGYIHAAFATGAVANGIDTNQAPVQTGTWTIQYDETDTGGPMVIWLYIILGPVTGGDPTSGPTGARNGTSPNFGVETIDGTIHTIVYTITYTEAASPTNYNFALGIGARNPNGVWTASNPFVFAPGNTIDRSNQAAPDDNVVAWLTTASGKGPISIRTMSQTAAYADEENAVNAEDLRQVSDFTWNVPPPTITTTVVAVRHFNANTLSTLYPWSSPKIYLGQYGYAGADDFGSYMNVSADDDGACFNQGSDQWWCAECRTSEPHGIQGLQDILFTNAAPGSIPITGGTTVSMKLLTGPAFVTGPDTFVILGFSSATGGTSPQTVICETSGGVAIEFTSANLTGLPCTVTMTQPAAPIIPIEVATYLCNKWSNCSMWVNIGITMTDACVQAYFERIKAVSTNSVPLWVEFVNENWNGASGGQQLIGTQVIGNLLPAQPGGTTIGISGIETETRYAVPNSSPPKLTRNEVYALRASQVQDIGALVFGNDYIFRVFGTQWTGESVTSDIMNTINGNINGQTGKLPCSAISGAPYSNSNTYGELTFVSACSPALGNWPCDQIIDFWQHEFKYTNINPPVYATIKNIINLYTGPAAPGQVDGLPIQVAYEAAITYVLPPGVSNFAALQHDLFFSPGGIDLQETYFRAIQDGDINTPLSGFSMSQHFSLADPWEGSSLSEMFGCSTWQGMLPGTGIGNTNTSGGTVPQKFTTYQGGLPGDGFAHDNTNDSTFLYGWRAWADTVNPGGSASFTESPTSIPQVSTSTLTFVGTNTDWTDDSVVSIQNSVTGGTDIVAGTFTAASTMSATLEVISGAGYGTFTVTIDGVVSSPITETQFLFFLFQNN